MIQFQNWYEATLTSPITSTSLNIPLTPVPPTITEGVLVLDYDNPSLREIIHFTSKDGVSVNCPSTGDTGTSGTGRGYEQTTARNHAQNAKVRMMLTAGVASSIQTGAATIANQNNNGGWIARAETPTYASNNGQREFTFTVPGDLTAVISQGMKLKMDRVVTPPTQAMSFASASSQYATKASPSGVGFTTAYTCEAWVYLLSYNGNNQYVVSRSDHNTGGFALRINPNGQLDTFYGGSSIFSDFISYATIPLTRWVHIAASVNAATKTPVLYINGVSVPFSTASANATAVTQISNLSVGAAGAGVAATFFNGYIAEARVWSVVQTQSQILANQYINLVGNEANLVFCARGNGDFTDRTVNGNTLTATNGAGFVTMATTPGTSYFNTTEQLIVNGKPSYTLPNTTFTVFGGTDFGLPSTGGLQNLYFSSQRAPFGFPATRAKWVTEFLCRTDSSSLSPSAGVWQNVPGHQLTIQTGEWRLMCEFIGAVQSQGFATLFTTLSTSTTAESDRNFSTHSFASITTGGFLNASIHRENFVTIDTPIAYYLNLLEDGNSNNLKVAGSQGTTVIRAESAYI